MRFNFNSVFFLLLLMISMPVVRAESIILAFHKSPPYSDVTERGQPKGMNYKIAMLIAQELDLDLDVHFCPFARCLTLMKEGKVDLMFGWCDERSESNI